MNLSDIGIIFTIITTIITGINFIFILIGRSFWSLTFKRLESDFLLLKEEVKNHERRVINIENSFSNVKDNFERLVKDMILITEKIEKISKETHDLINLVNNKMLKDGVVDDIDKKFDIILNKLNEKE